MSETSFSSQQKLKDENAQLSRDLQSKNSLLLQFEQRVDRLNAQLDLLQASRSQGDIMAVDLHAAQEDMRRMQMRLDRAEAELKEAAELKMEIIKLRGDARELLDSRLENSKLQTTIKLLTVQND